jgi:hypothetical protein
MRLGCRGASALMYTEAPRGAGCGGGGGGELGQAGMGYFEDSHYQTLTTPRWQRPCAEVIRCARYAPSLGFRIVTGYFLTLVCDYVFGNVGLCLFICVDTTLTTPIV